MIRIQIQILELPHKISTYEKANELKMLNAKVAGRGNGDNSKAPQKTQGGKSSKERSSFPFSFSCGGLWGRAFGSRANTPSWGYAPTTKKLPQFLRVGCRQRHQTSHQNTFIFVQHDLPRYYTSQ